jgi:threonine dehydrogenase-like Zn-dependent dehydrogenase
LKLAEGLLQLISKGSAVEQVNSPTVGADRGCECVGYQCCDKHGKEHSNVTMNELVQAVKATGSIGVVGVLF